MSGTRYIAAFAMGTAAAWLMALAAPDCLAGNGWSNAFRLGRANGRAYGDAYQEESDPAAGASLRQESSGPLSLDTIPQSQDDIPMWGVIHTDGNAYRKDGKKLADPVRGGTLVEISKMTFTSKGVQMALCALWDTSASKWSEPTLVPSANIAIFEGTRDGVLASDLERLMAYCRLTAALAARKAELEKAAIDANPYTKRIRELNVRNRELSARSKELVKRRDSLSGAERNAVADELRTLLAESTSISQRLKELVSLYEDWKRSHPGAETADTANDPECTAIRAKLRAAAPGVEMFDLPGGLGGADLE